MSSQLNLNKDQSQVLDAPVRRIEVAVGQALVTRPAPAAPEDNDQVEAHDPQPQTINAGDYVDFDGAAGLIVHDLAGSVIQVTYTDDPEVVVPKPKTERKSKRTAARRSQSETKRATSSRERVEDDKARIKKIDAADSKAQRKAAQSTDRRAAKKSADANRGDTGGSTGSFESRTLKELQATAKERGLTGVSKLSKDKLIKKLRG